MIRAFSLLSLTAVAPWLKSAYVIVTLGMILWGLSNLLHPVVSGMKLSLLLSAVEMLLFILSSQPYASALAFLLLGIKTFLLTKKQ